MNKFKSFLNYISSGSLKMTKDTEATMSNTRRRFLKIVGASTVAVSGVGTVSADSPSNPLTDEGKRVPAREKLKGITKRNKDISSKSRKLLIEALQSEEVDLKYSETPKELRNTHFITAGSNVVAVGGYMWYKKRDPSESFDQTHNDEERMFSISPRVLKKKGGVK